VLLWNPFPTRNDQPADLRLTAGGNMGTPRQITSDGTHLIVGDHNARISAPGDANFYWKTWPTRNDQPPDFYGDRQGPWLRGAFTPDGKLLMVSERMYVWNSFPQSATQAPDLTVGEICGPVAAGAGYAFCTSDGGSGVAVAGDRVYVSQSNKNKIVMFNTVPSSPAQRPDFAIGGPDVDTNTLDTNYLIQNGVPVTDGRSLFVSSDFDRRRYVWRSRRERRAPGLRLPLA
jgi:hypothetical protein